MESRYLKDFVSSESLNLTTYPFSNLVPFDYINKYLDSLLIWRGSLVSTIQFIVREIDILLSKQLDCVMHHETFFELEGAWRGLYRLLFNISEDINFGIILKLLNATKSELIQDFLYEPDYKKTHLFKIVYDYEFGTPGGIPFSIILTDYYFTHSENDILILKYFSKISEEAFCPFVSAASPELFGIDRWDHINKIRNLTLRMSGDEYQQWDALRKLNGSRFQILTLPRVSARARYASLKNSNHYHYDEYIKDKNISCWMSSAYLYGEVLINAYKKTGWCTSIRGYHTGGRVNDLPMRDRSVEIDLSDCCEAELSRLGFMPLSAYRNTNYAVFFGSSTLHFPSTYGDSAVDSNAQISSKIPYILASSRFAHYLKILARDRIGDYMQREDVENWLNQWILNYTNANAGVNAELRLRYPLVDARVEVTERIGYPGSYQAVAWLKPWLQLEELSASIRLVADIPSR